VDTGVTVVVGAGLAGLTAAHRWRLRGEEVIVVEKAPFVGGMARSLARDGFVFDFGPHFIIEKTPLLEELFAPDELIPFNPEIYMVLGKHRIRYPFTPASLRQVPLRVQSEFLRTRIIGPRADVDHGAPSSFRHNTSTLFGSAMYDYFFRPYLTKKFGGVDISDTIHGDWWAMAQHTRGIVTREPIPVTQPSHAVAAVKKMLRLTRELPYIFKKTLLWYPKAGFGEISRRLSALATQNGVNIRLETEVSEIRRDARRITSVVVNGEEIPVRRLIWTASPNVLARQLGTAPLDLPTLHAIVYFVSMDRRYPRKGTEIRPIGPEHAFYRAYFPEVICESLTPNGRSAVVAEVGTLDRNDLATAGDRYEQVINTCVELGLCPRSGVTDIFHAVQPDCYPVYPLDYEAHLQRYYAELAPIENLLLSGRNARFQYFNSHQVRDAERTLDDVLF
jgi:protoporphyrinogen oxidase